MQFETERHDRFSEVLITFLIAVLTPAAPAAGVDPTSTDPTSVGPTSVDPTIAGEMPLEVDFALQAAFRVALERLRARPPCRALFTDLGADGRAVLIATAYYAAPETLEHLVCRRRSAVAFTGVGSPATGLCVRNFLQLNRFHAAYYLIHEALHHAGLVEWPMHPEALTSAEIRRLVQQRCGRSSQGG